ncbi:MAG: TolC family protein [Bacteroidota bacterium]
MKHINRLILSLVLTLPMSGLHAQDRPLTLDSILSRIARNHPELRGYDQRAEALRAGAGGAKALMAPMAGIGTFMTPYPGQRIMEESEKGSVMVSVEQTITNRSKREANGRYLGARADAETYRRAGRWNLLRAEARAACIRWNLASERKRNLSTLEQTGQLMLEVARARITHNQEQPAAVYKAESRLAEIRNMMDMEQVTMDESRAQLAAMMGLPSGTMFRLDSTARPSLPVLAAATDTASLAASRSDIRIIDQEIRLMRLNRELQLQQARPDYRLRFDHMQPIGNMPAQFTAMAMVSIPIAPWSAPMYKAEAAGMEHQISAMELERSAMLLENRGMLERMRIQVNGMQKQLDRYEQQILPALEKNAATVRAAWTENRESLPMVLDALEALAMSRQEYLNKKESYYLMINEYEKLAEQ